MSAIYPLDGTYLMLIPVELRKLLYSYVNTSHMKYKIRYRKDIRLELIYPSRIVIYMIFNKIHVKNTDIYWAAISTFLNLSKQKMTYYGNINLEHTYLILNPLTTLSLINSNDVDLITYMDESLENITNVITIPLSIEFVEALEKVYDIIKVNE